MPPQRSIARALEDVHGLPAVCVCMCAHHVWYTNIIKWKKVKSLGPADVLDTKRVKVSPCPVADEFL